MPALASPLKSLIGIHKPAFNPKPPREKILYELFPCAVNFSWHCCGPFISSGMYSAR